MREQLAGAPLLDPLFHCVPVRSEEVRRSVCGQRDEVRRDQQHGNQQLPEHRRRQTVYLCALQSFEQRRQVGHGADQPRIVAGRRVVSRASSPGTLSTRDAAHRRLRGPASRAAASRTPAPTVDADSALAGSWREYRTSGAPSVEQRCTATRESSESSPRP